MHRIEREKPHAQAWSQYVHDAATEIFWGAEPNDQMARLEWLNGGWWDDQWHAANGLTLLETLQTVAWIDEQHRAGRWDHLDIRHFYEMSWPIKRG